MEAACRLAIVDPADVGIVDNYGRGLGVLIAALGRQKRGRVFLPTEPAWQWCFDPFPSLVLLGPLGDSVAVHCAQGFQRESNGAHIVFPLDVTVAREGQRNLFARDETQDQTWLLRAGVCVDPAIAADLVWAEERLHHHVL